jgi:hypothetical protein
MHGDGKSDRPVVPAIPPNKAASAAAELLHHVSLGRLRAASWAIRPQAAPGVTWAGYGQDPEANLQALHARVRCSRNGVAARSLWCAPAGIGHVAGGLE